MHNRNVDVFIDLRVYSAGSYHKSCVENVDVVRENFIQINIWLVNYVRAIVGVNKPSQNFL